MQTLAPPTAGHRAAGELVDDDHLAALDDVVDVLELQLLGLEGVDDVRRPLLPRVVQVRHLEDVLSGLVTVLGEDDVLLLLLHRVVHIPHKRVGDLRSLVVLDGGGLGLPRDDEWRPRLVDEDGVHLVDDAVVEVPQHKVRLPLRKVVAEVVESELRVGHVGDVAVVGVSPLLLSEPRLDEADREAKEAVHLPNPLAVAPRQVVVHSDNVNALPAESVEEGGQHGDEGLSLPGAHLRDLAGVQHGATNELRVKRAEAKDTVRRLANDGKSFWQERIQQLSAFGTFTKLRCLQA
mmetsp:Transcript_29572/g.70442  ORF Transcript_29572/g.70442 Transcript_29572/m.70442 type:complete len:293 (-) Transcript_29572:419-1297(-)